MSTHQARTNEARRRASGFKLLATSALTTASALSIAAPAIAGDGPVGDYDVIILENTQAAEESLGYNVYRSNDRIVDNAIQEDIGRLGHTHFDAPVSVITGVEQGTTQILGKLTSTGDVYILDVNGVLFGKDAVVDVNGIAATTGSVTFDADTITFDDVAAGAGIINDGSITAQEFAIFHAESFTNNGDIMVGNGGRFIAAAAEQVKLSLNDPSIEINDVLENGVIVNTGTISVGNAGLAAFVSPFVTNSGVISAKMGTVAMAAGETVTLDMYGDGLFEVAGRHLSHHSGEALFHGGYPFRKFHELLTDSLGSSLSR